MNTQQNPKSLSVGLMNLEPKIENTALMQISFYHKQQGDTVEWYSPLFKYDKIYAASLFSFTDKSQVPKSAVTGGTGFNVRSELPPEIADCDLDYSIYPKCETSYLWFSRGCIRQCPFCVVPTKEGKLHYDRPKNLNPKAKRVSVMDNSFTALDSRLFDSAIAVLESIGLPVDFQCGLDARLPTVEKWQTIKKKLRIYHQIRTAWDDPKQDLTENLTKMSEVFGKNIMVYVLIGYWSTPQEDLERVLKIRDIGLDAWVMPYNKKGDIYQRAFERWCNRHANCEWKDYKHGEWK